MADEVTPVTIRDKRKVDPETGDVREVTVEDTVTSAPEPANNPYLEDLQRLKAEFDNYRKRVERDRALYAEQGAARVIVELLPVLDDIDRARAHGEVDGAVATVVDALELTLGKLGVERIGEVGDPFDPQRHEAVMHTTSPDVTEASCVEVMRSGYLFAGRLLRPAMVAVADPEPASVDAG